MIQNVVNENFFSKKIDIADEFIEICKEIKQLNMTIQDWAECESGDMFQSESFCGGFDSTDNEFGFGYFEEENEYWFGISLEEVEQVINRKLIEMTVFHSDDGRSIDDSFRRVCIDIENDYRTDSDKIYTERIYRAQYINYNYYFNFIEFGTENYLGKDRIYWFLLTPGELLKVNNMTEGLILMKHDGNGNEGYPNLFTKK